MEGFLLSVAIVRDIGLNIRCQTYRGILAVVGELAYAIDHVIDHGVCGRVLGVEERASQQQHCNDENLLNHEQPPLKKVSNDNGNPFTHERISDDDETQRVAGAHAPIITPS